MTVRRIHLDNCEPWRVEGGILARPDKRFFSGFLTKSQAWILQPEIGVLGFVITETPTHKKVLLQLKEEPGNKALTQIAPTVQATRSNWEQVHRGAAQPYIEYFNDGEGTKLNSVLNSEQGSRFWRKRNENSLVSVNRELMGSSNHKWFPILELRSALSESFQVNTDSRSVLASSDWRLFEIQDSPAADRDHPLMTELRLSISESRCAPDVPLSLLHSYRSRIMGTTNPGSLLESRSSPREAFEWGIGETSFRFYAVEAPFREVAEWKQPLFVSRNAFGHQLVISKIDGHFKVLTKIVAEQGLYLQAEFGPSISSRVLPAESHKPGPESDLLGILEDFGEVLREIDQSDEGGRFFEEISNYRLVWIEPHHLMSDNQIRRKATGPSYAWVSLGELNQLCSTSMATTNELRTLCSLLLS